MRSWVVGCDGIHSPTRELSGIGFEGHDIAKPWAVFDATLQGWAEPYEGTSSTSSNVPVILTALPGQRWRVYLRPSSEESDLVADAASTIRRYEPAASFVDVREPDAIPLPHQGGHAVPIAGRSFWPATRRTSARPAEGHGMNCGLQDAFNLAWKLALVYQARPNRHCSTATRPSGVPSPKWLRVPAMPPSRPKR